MQYRYFTGWLFYKEYTELVRKGGHRASITRQYLKVLVCTVFLYIFPPFRLIVDIYCLHEGLSQPEITEAKDF